MDRTGLRVLRDAALVAALLAVALLALPPLATAETQTAPSPTTTPAPSTPETKAPPSATPPAPAPTPTTPSTKAAPAPSATTTPTDKTAPGEKPPAAEAPTGQPGPTEIEPNGSPGVPQNATTESVTVPSRVIVTIGGKSSYDDAFKSIKASLETLKAAMEKKGLKPTGHPITIFSEPDDKGFKYKAAVPIAAKPDGAPDLGAGITIDQSPAGKAIKFQHRGAYDDIDSTYDVITAYLDAKGLQVDNPYIEEYLTDLTTADDPNLQVDIYVFVK